MKWAYGVVGRGSSETPAEGTGPLTTCTHIQIPNRALDSESCEVRGRNSLAHNPFVKLHIYVFTTFYWLLIQTNKM